MANADQSPSEALGPSPTHHSYDAPGLTPRAFLLAVMHDRHAPIRDRIKAASTLLRLYPHDWDPPAFTYRIGGILPAPYPRRHRQQSKEQKITVISPRSLIKLPAT